MAIIKGLNYTLDTLLVERFTKEEFCEFYNGKIKAYLPSIYDELIAKYDGSKGVKQKAKKSRSKRDREKGFELERDNELDSSGDKEQPQ